MWGAGGISKLTITSRPGPDPRMQKKGANRVKGWLEPGQGARSSQPAQPSSTTAGQGAVLTGALPTAGHGDQGLTSEEHWPRGTTLI